MVGPAALRLAVDELGMGFAMKKRRACRVVGLAPFEARGPFFGDRVLLVAERPGRGRRGRSSRDLELAHTESR